MEKKEKRRKRKIKIIRSPIDFPRARSPYCRAFDPARLSALSGNTHASHTHTARTLTPSGHTMCAHIITVHESLLNCIIIIRIKVSIKVTFGASQVTGCRRWRELLIIAAIRTYARTRVHVGQVYNNNIGVDNKTARRG